MPMPVSFTWMASQGLPGSFFFAVQRHSYTAMFRRELKGIGYQVKQDAFQFIVVKTGDQAIAVQYRN